MKKTICSTACLTALLLGAGLGVPGCSSRGSATVSGTVTYQGKKVTSGNVVFVGADGKASLPAHIQEDGTYTARRVPIGPVKVAVNNPPPVNYVPGVNVPRQMASDPEVQQVAREVAHYTPTPPQYADPGKSGLSTTLKGGSNSYNIALR
jgi:hypothetical protein